MGFLTSIPNYIHYSVCKQPPRPYSSIAPKNFFCQKKILPTLKFKTNKPSGPRLDLYQVGFSQSPKLRNCCKNVHIFSPLECELTNVKKEDVNSDSSSIYNLKVFKNCWHFPTVLPTPPYVGKNTFALSSKTATATERYRPIWPVSSSRYCEHIFLLRHSQSFVNCYSTLIVPHYFWSPCDWQEIKSSSWCHSM